MSPAQAKGCKDLTAIYLRPLNDMSRQYHDAFSKRNAVRRLAVLRRANANRVEAEVSLGSAINAISGNGALIGYASEIYEQRCLVCAGGRDVLRVVKVSIPNTLDDAKGAFEEILNMRNHAKKKGLNLSTVDVKWSPSSPNLVATAATNGAVISWDLEASLSGKTIPRNRALSLQECVFTEHTRSVNRVAWHASDAHLLLSGSQDGTIKMWDRRQQQSTVTLKPNAQSVRDVQFSPTSPWRLAACFDNGTVQLWDVRKAKNNISKLTAHNGIVLAIDWHPTQDDIIASGGRDRWIHVWNISKRSMKSSKRATGRMQALQHA